MVNPSTRLVIAVLIMSCAAVPALALDQGACTVTEVAPGVKMRSAPCSNPFASPFAAPQQPRRPEALPAGARTNTLRFGDTEIRTGGSARFETQGGRP
jgi:hypothetical protein